MVKFVENGRTMVEMVGVLTLIGVLTVGALALYDRAISSLQANDLLNEVRKHVVLKKMNGGASIKQRHSYHPLAAGLNTASLADATEKKLLTAYGFSLNTHNVLDEAHHAISNYREVTVGRVAGSGRAIPKGLCKVLLSRKVADADAKPGDIVAIRKSESTGEDTDGTALTTCDKEYSRLFLKIKLYDSSVD